jgi:hypothetical protein
MNKNNGIRRESQLGSFIDKNSFERKSYVQFTIVLLPSWELYVYFSLRFVAISETSICQPLQMHFGNWSIWYSEN